MVVSRMADQIGRVLSGRYRLVAPIGTGASAQVYLADDVRLRRRVAVKLLHDALADDDAFLRRFRAEAQAAAALNHPNLLAVYDWGDDDGTPYLVTEHLAGGSLRTVLDQGVLLTPSQAVLVGLEATRALDYAHKRGFVHRDIKPANLLFGDDGRLRIADFGLARAIAEAAWTEPQGAVLGTARYASPEQAQGQPVDGKADVYSLGLVLIEAVTGSVPFAADTTIATLMGRIGKPVPVPESMGPLRKALERAGQPEPEDRPDAGELGVNLMAAAEKLPRPEPLPLTLAAPVLDLTESADVTMLGGTTLAEPPADGDAPTIVGTPATAAVPPSPAVPPEFLDAALDPSGPLDRPRRPFRKVLLAIVVAVLLGVGAAWAYDRAQGPVYEVPALAGKTEQQAMAALDPYGFAVEVEQARKDGSVPGQILETRPAAGESLHEGDTITLVVSLGNTPARVPTDLVGKSLAEATAALKAAGGFTPQVQGVFDEQAPKDQVMAMGDGVQAEMPKGSAVPIVVSKGPQPRTVPRGLEGGTYDAAASALAATDLKAKKTEAFSDTVAAGKVIELRPSGGAQAARDSTVEVLVSKGPDLVVVPDVNGLTLDKAIARLEGAGLVVGEVSGPAKGKPFVTDPLAGQKVKRGSTVDIYLRR